MTTTPSQSNIPPVSRPLFRTICAWCGQGLQQSDPPVPLTANSHGICAGCADDFFGMRFERTAAGSLRLVE